jgi:steroid delta-isomerase
MASLKSCHEVLLQFLPCRPAEGPAFRQPFDENARMATHSVNTDSPALKASQSSWACVQAHDRTGWLALMADDAVIEDPIGPSITNPDGLGVRGKDAIATFYDTNIAPNQLTITCEQTFPSSSPDEIAHILILHSRFDGGFTSTVRGVFTYRVNEAGLIAQMRGYWNIEAMVFKQEDA